MSRPRLHDALALLYESKNESTLQECLMHSQYLSFMNLHGFQIPLKEFVPAFTHTSFSHEYPTPHQELLEFLGDSVLQLIMTDELFRLFPQEKEGRLSKLRSAIVNEKSLARLGLALKINELILVGKGEFKKTLFLQEAVLADTLEALLGQVYRHQGFEFTQKLFLNWLKAFTPEVLSMDYLDDFDAKSKIQEWALARYKKLPRYTSEPVGEGFEIKLWINDEMLAQGMFTSRKNGEKELARDVFKKGLI